MDRNVLNYLTDAGLIVTFAVCFVTGILKFRYLLSLMGIAYFDLPLSMLTDIHDWSGIAMGVLVALHIVLHWRWIVSTTTSFFRRGK